MIIASPTGRSRTKQAISVAEIPCLAGASRTALRRPGDDIVERNAPAGVGLRVEEHLHVADAIAGGSLEVGICQIGEVRRTE